MTRARQGCMIRCIRKDCRTVLVRMDEATFKKFAAVNCPDVFCLKCHARGEVNEINGRITERVCDARCMGATANACDCSCGGQNHGCSA